MALFKGHFFCPGSMKKFSFPDLSFLALFRLKIIVFNEKFPLFI